MVNNVINTNSLMNRLWCIVVSQPVGLLVIVFLSNYVNDKLRAGEEEKKGKNKGMEEKRQKAHRKPNSWNRPWSPVLRVDPTETILL